MKCKCGGKMIGYYRQQDKVFLMECAQCKKRRRYDTFEDMIIDERQDLRESKVPILH